MRQPVLCVLVLLTIAATAGAMPVPVTWNNGITTGRLSWLDVNQAPRYADDFWLGQSTRLTEISWVSLDAFSSNQTAKVTIDIFGEGAAGVDPLGNPMRFPGSLLASMAVIGQGSIMPGGLVSQRRYTSGVADGFDVTLPAGHYFVSVHGKSAWARSLRPNYPHDDPILAERSYPAVWDPADGSGWQIALADRFGQAIPAYEFAFKLSGETAGLPTVIPEPATCVLFGLALGAGALLLRRRRRRA